MLGPYFDYLHRQTARWSRGNARFREGNAYFSDFCTLEAARIFDFTLALPATPFFLTTNFLYEKFGAEMPSIARKLRWSMSLLNIHAETDEAATTKEAIEWFQDERRWLGCGGRPTYPGSIVPPSYCRDVCAYILECWASCYESRPVHFSDCADPLVRESVVEILRSSAARSTVADEMRDLVAVYALAEPTTFQITVDPLCVEERPRIEDELVSLLYQWARLAPVELPVMAGQSDRAEFLVPQYLLAGRYLEIERLLARTDDDTARLVLREIRRLRRMPTLARCLAYRNQEWQPYAAQVEANLRWLH